MPADQQRQNANNNRTVGPVCMIVHAYYPADETRVKREAEFLARLDCAVDVICLQDRGEPWQEKVNGVRVYRLPVRRHRKAGPLVYALEYGAFGLLAGILTTLRFLFRRYRVIEVNTLPDPLVFAAMVPKLLGARVVLNMHETAPDLMMERLHVGPDHWFTRFIVWWERMSVRFADGVVTVSEPVRQVIQQRSGRHDLAIVMNVADEGIFTPLPPDRRARESRRPVSVVYHGLIAASYDLRVVLKAMSVESFPLDRMVLDVYGSGPLEETLKDMSKSLGLTDRVTFHGFVPMEKVARLVAEADIGIVPVSPSYYADFALPTKLLEYVALDVPVVVPAFRTIRHYFTDEMVQCYTSGDHEDLAQALGSLILSPERRQQLARRAAAFNATYSWKRQSESYLGFLQAITTGSAGRHES
jgi:glycosyltransferase involved in cell wall biosynthesis